MTTQRLLSEPDAAAYMGTSVGHLRKLRYRRALAYVKVGQLVRYDIKALERYITANTIGRAS